MDFSEHYSIALKIIDKEPIITMRELNSINNI